MGVHVKSLTEIQVDDTCYFSLVHQCSQSISEGYWVGQAGPALGEAMLAVLNEIANDPIETAEIIIIRHYGLQQPMLLMYMM